MNCPKCNVKLKPDFYEGVEIDKCDNCNGCWLDEGEIVNIIDDKTEKFN